MKKHYKLLGIGMGLFLILRFVSENFLVSESIKNNSASHYNVRSRGLSFLHEYLKESGKEPVIVKEKYIFLDQNKRLPKNGLVLLSSPQFNLSNNDMSILFEWMNEGGVVWISVENKDQMEILNSFLSQWNFRTDMLPLDTFKNHEVQPTASTKDIGPFRNGKTYSFYSPLRFEKCDERIDCFVKEKSIGQGALWVTLGLSPISNAMVWRDDNPLLLKELAGKEILVDEQIHGFTEREFSDLFKRPEFMIPISSIFIFSFLILFFSKNRETFVKKKMQAPKDFHDFNLEVLRGLWREASLRRSLQHFYAQLLGRRGVTDLKKTTRWATEMDTKTELLQMQKRYVEHLEKKGFRL